MKFTLFLLQNCVLLERHVSVAVLKIEIYVSQRKRKGTAHTHTHIVANIDDLKLNENLNDIVKGNHAFMHDII